MGSIRAFEHGAHRQCQPPFVGWSVEVVPRLCRQSEPHRVVRIDARLLVGMLHARWQKFHRVAAAVLNQTRDGTFFSASRYEYRGKFAMTRLERDFPREYAAPAVRGETSRAF